MENYIRALYMGRSQTHKSVEIEPQEKEKKLFLIDTFLCENLDVKTAISSAKIGFFGRLHKAIEEERHACIDAEIGQYFQRKG